MECNKKIFNSGTCFRKAFTVRNTVREAFLCTPITVSDLMSTRLTEDSVTWMQRVDEVCSICTTDVLAGGITTTLRC